MGRFCDDPWLPAAEAAALRKRVKAVLAGSDSFVVDPARAKLDPAEADELSAALNDEARKLLASVAELLSSADGETIGRLARQVQITRDRGSSRTMD